MKTHKLNQGPCRPMRPLLDEAADGRRKGLRAWYAEAHAARCPGCGLYLETMKALIGRLGSERDNEPTEDRAAIERISERLGL